MSRGAALPAVGAQGLVRRIFTYLPSSLMPALLTVITSMIFTRVFPTAAFGTYSLFLTLANLVKFLLTTWLVQSTGKFVPQEAGEAANSERTARDAVFLAMLIVLAVESLLGLATMLVLPPHLGAAERPFLLAAVAFVVVTSSFDMIGNLYAMEARAKQYTTYKLLDSGATFGLRLLMISAVIGLGTDSMFWSVIVSNAVLVPIMWRRIGLPNPSSVVRVARSPKVSRMLVSFCAFGLPMTIWTFSATLLDLADRFVLNFYLGAGVVGIYDASYRVIAGTASLMAVPVTVTLHPHLMSISGSGDSARISRVLGVIIENLVVVGALAVSLAVIFYPDIALILLGPQFRPGAVIMPVVLAGLVFYNISLFAHKPMEIKGNTRSMLIFSLVAAAANIALNLALVPVMSYVGAAVATLLSYLVYAVGVGVIGRKIFPWRVDLRRLSVQLAVLVIGTVAAHTARVAVAGESYWVGLGVASVFGAAMTGWTAWRLLWRPSNADLLGWS